MANINYGFMISRCRYLTTCGGEEGVFHHSTSPKPRVVNGRCDTWGKRWEERWWEAGCCVLHVSCSSNSFQGRNPCFFLCFLSRPSLCSMPTGSTGNQCVCHHQHSLLEYSSRSPQPSRPGDVLWGVPNIIPHLQFTAFRRIVQPWHPAAHPIMEGIYHGTFKEHRGKFRAGCRAQTIFLALWN